MIGILTLIFSIIACLPVFWSIYKYYYIIKPTRKEYASIARRFSQYETNIPNLIQQATSIKEKRIVSIAQKQCLDIYNTIDNMKHNKNNPLIMDTALVVRIKKRDWEDIIQEILKGTYDNIIIDK